MQQREEHGWGRMEVLETTARFQVKRLTLNPGARLTLQPHVQRAAHWVVLSGRARITRGATVLQIVADESLHLPPRLRHSVENDGDAPLELIQVLTGDHPGDEDLAGHVPAAAAGTASV